VSAQQAVARAVRTRAALMLLSLDLDRFKQINDTLGHAAGDEVLKEFGFAENEIAELHKAQAV